MTMQSQPGPGPWIRYAECADQDGELFFLPEYANIAKRICARCPVRLDCLTYALECGTTKHGASGVWGGMTHEERALLTGVEL